MAKRKWTGEEVGKALVASIIHDIRHQNESDYKPLFSQSDFDKMELSLNTERDYLTYEIYRGLYRELVDAYNKGQAIPNKMIELDLYLFSVAKEKAIIPSIVPTNTAELKPFTAMLNGAATNQLTNISTRSNPPIVDTITGNATIEHGTLKVFIDSYNELTGGLRTSTHKLLDACTIALTQQNNYRGKDDKLNPLVTISLERFMELCGIPLTKPSKDKTRRKVKEDLETLYHISMEWTETSKRKTKDFAKMRVCDKIAIVNGNIIFSFSMDMAKYLTSAYLMQYPVELLKVDERNPNSYHIGKKLLLHNSIDNNRRKGTAHILSVKNLLEVCPDISTYEQVSATGRQLDQRIRTPFETALNSLSFLINWEYCNSKGVPLTDEQLQSTDYNTFIKFYIKFDVIGAPDQTARLEARAEEVNAAKKKRTNSKRKADSPSGKGEVNASPSKEF